MRIGRWPSRIFDVTCGRESLRKWVRMTDNPISKSCPQCGRPLPAEAPQGLCPSCLLGSAATATEAGQPPGGPEPPPLQEIRAAFPQLEILELIGQGGMGFVYQARQPKLDRFVALKLLWPKLAEQPAFAERFNREAKLLARLNHPNIVAVYDFGQAGKFFFLLMEFVDGVNMRQAMKSGRFSPAEALTLVPRICDALQFAHEEGILHRDIKPENILLDTKGRLKIADFGIAKLIGERPGSMVLTDTGVALGTPHYMAPEQLEHPQDVDRRADIYSLGVVFYEMLTGELPVGRFAPPSERAPVDPRVDEVVLRTLEKQREKRYGTAGEVKTRVEDIRRTPISGPTATQAPGPHGTVAAGAAPPRLDEPPSPPRSGSGKAGWAGGEQPRWSRKAIAAAILDLLAVGGIVLAGVVSLFFYQASVGPRAVVASQPSFLFVAAFVILPLGFLALPGTILGVLALVDKRRAGGLLRGGDLALWAALFWPMLLVNTFVLKLVMGSLWLHHGVAPWFSGAGLLLAMAILNVSIAAAVWRWATPGARFNAAVPALLPLVAILMLPAVLVLAFSRVRGEPLQAPEAAAGYSGGVKADFVLPAGQVAVFEILRQDDGQPVPIPELGAYAVAAPDQEMKGTFKCMPGQLTAVLNENQNWNLEISGAGNKSAVSGRTVQFPGKYVFGEISLWKTLSPDSESIHWAGPGDEEHPPIGLRIRTFRSEPQLASQNSTVGIGTNWHRAFSPAEAP